MITLTKEQRSIIEDFCDDHEYNFRDSYSGRCMYGKSCIGFVCDDDPFLVAMNLVRYCDEIDNREIIEIFQHAGGARMDDMGRSTILYFPSIQAEE